MLLSKEIDVVIDSLCSHGVQAEKDERLIRRSRAHARNATHDHDLAPQHSQEKHLHTPPVETQRDTDREGDCAQAKSGLFRSSSFLRRLRQTPTSELIQGM